MKQQKLHYSNVTDGTPMMVDKEEGLKKSTEDYALATSNSYLMKHRCILHQENLCTEALKIGNIVQIKSCEFHEVQGIELSPIPEVS